MNVALAAAQSLGDETISDSFQKILNNDISEENVKSVLDNMKGLTPL